MENHASKIVKIVWDLSHRDMQTWEVPATLSLSHLVEGRGAAPMEPEPEEIKGYMLRNKRPGRDLNPEALDVEKPERLSLQLYCSYPADVGALNDFDDKTLFWHGEMGISDEQCERAKDLMKLLYLAKEEPQPSRASDDWSASLARLKANVCGSLSKHDSLRDGGHDRPSELAALAVSLATPLDHGNHQALACLSRRTFSERAWLTATLQRWLRP